LKKLLNIYELKDILNNLRKQKKTIVFTNGCFDILHAGHLSLLKRARRLGDFLIVGLNSDISIKKIKGKTRPILNEKIRALAIDFLPWVDAVVKFNEETPEKLIKIIKPDFIVKGADWTGKKLPAEDFVKEYGGRYVRLKLVKGISTSNIINTIKNKIN